MTIELCIRDGIITPGLLVLTPMPDTDNMQYSKEGAVPRPAKRKEKWTLSFNLALKSAVVKAAKRRGVYPVTVLETLVRGKFNPYGHMDVDDSAAYMTALRKQGRKQSDDAFLDEIEAWKKRERLEA
jgi:hypothetical protein